MDLGSLHSGDGATLSSTTVNAWSSRTLSVLDYFSVLVAQDQGLPLLEAAAAIAQDDEPELDVQQVLMQVDALAERLFERLPDDAAPVQRLRVLNHFFFRELAFGGNVNDYYDVRNSHIHAVLASRRGIPITLAVLYLELAQHARLSAHGVSFPGHFLVKISLPKGEVVVDPFTGQSLSREDLEHRLAPYRRRHGLKGDFETPLGLFLQAAAPRDILARMLRNLKEIHRTAQDHQRLLAVQERLVLLLPRDWDERRDRGLAYAQLGMAGPAAEDLAEYLAHCSHASDAGALARQLADLRRAPSWRLP
jgi:regulator of sirC expression with transglutaminase-like and TPR domain